MALRSLFILLILLLFSTANSLAQVSPDQYSFNYYSTAQGLSNNSVICTVQDKLGYIWIGTKDGLNRFDGRFFKVYRNKAGDSSSISNNYILKLFLDSDSVLWIGTRGGGLCRYNRKTDSFTCFTYDTGNPNSISHPEVLSIYEDKDNKLWIGTDGGGLNLLDKETLTIAKFDRINSLKVLSITEYDNENLLLGTWDNGLNIFNKRTGTCKAIKSEKNKLASNNIWLVQKECNQGFWIGHFEAGLQFFNKTSGEYTTLKFPNDPILSVYTIVKQAPDRIWIGTSAGIYTTRITFRENQIHYEPLTLFSNFLSLQFTLSENKSIWASNFDNGLMHIHLSNPQFKITEFSKTQSSYNYTNLFVNSFQQGMEEELILGTTHGAFKYIPAKDELVMLEDTTKNKGLSKRISIIRKNAENELFAGKALFLAKFDPISQQFVKHFKLPADLNPNDRDGYYDLLFEKEWLWMATENGLFKQNLLSKKNHAVIKNNTKHNGFNIYQIRSIDADSENIYAATLGGGLVVIDRKTENFEVFQYNRNKPESISSNQINQVYISSKGQIWLATFNGLVYFDKKQKTFKHLGIKEGFQAEFLTAIAEDFKGNLWISSQQGITKYNPQTHKTENYYFFSQLNERIFQVKSAFTDKNGKIYFGRRTGFISFHPDSIELNSHPPKVLITGFKINNQEVIISPTSALKSNIENTREIVLSHQQNSFSLSYAAMDFSFPERNKYAYKLENLNRDWIFTNDVSVNYTKIPPGHYRFRVKAANQDGIWNEKGTSVDIVIKPALWQTLAFKLVTGTIFLIIFIIWYRRKIHKVERDKRHLQKLVDAKTVELSETNRVLEFQNEELKLNKEELQSQRDALTDANQLLEEKTIEIETQNRELESHRENLEKLILERTSELKIALEKAEQSDRLKTAFLANLSHEIRTPLNAIVGFSTLINDDQLALEKRHNYSKIIQSSSESLLVLIDDLLNLAKIETDQVEINPKHFPVNKFLNELFIMFSEEQERDIDFRLIAGIVNSEVFLYTDQTRLQQIVVNLITNALKFTEEGFVEIGYFIENKTVLHLYVKDTGIGIEQHNFDYIFERFRKLEGGNKLYRGAGLGLAISKKLADLLGARLWLESEFGKGSTFYISFNNNFTVK